MKAVVFDFDGLILDTETAEYHAFAHICREHGTELPLEVWGQCIGTDVRTSRFDPYVYLEERLGRSIDREQIHLRRREKYEALLGRAAPRPGVESYLQAARRLGLRIGLASSSKRSWITGYLEQMNLLDYFDCIRSKDDVANVKPDPELYRQAVAALGVAPREAVAFEDSPNGSLAARRAGLRCVVVPNEVTSALRFGDVDLRLASMADMPLEEVLARLSAE